MPRRASAMISLTSLFCERRVEGDGLAENEHKFIQRYTTIHFEGMYLCASLEQAFQRKRTDAHSSSSPSITTTEHSSRILARDCDLVGKKSLASAGLRVVTGVD